MRGLQVVQRPPRWPDPTKGRCGSSRTYRQIVSHIPQFRRDRTCVGQQGGRGAWG